MDLVSGHPLTGRRRRRLGLRVPDAASVTRPRIEGVITVHDALRTYGLALFARVARTRDDTLTLRTIW